MEIINIEKLLQAVKSFKNVLIFLSKDYSFDELAAALSLGAALEKTAKKVVIFSPKLPVVGQASLFGISKVVNQLNSDKLVISIPDALASVDKVTHYLEGDVLNIVVHPINDSETPLKPETVKISQTGTTTDLIILINSPSWHLMNILGTQEQKFYSNLPKFLIGKMSENLKDEIIITGPTDSSISETVVWILDKLGLPMDSDIAANLFQGINFATSFIPPKATAETFKAAAICLEHNPNLTGQLPISKSPQKTSYDFGSDDPNLASSFTQNQKLDLKAPKVVEDEETDVLPENSQVQKDWLIPKIFKSSQTPKKT